MSTAIKNNIVVLTKYQLNPWYVDIFINFYLNVDEIKQIRCHVDKTYNFFLIRRHKMAQSKQMHSYVNTIYMLRYICWHTYEDRIYMSTVIKEYIDMSTPQALLSWYVDIHIKMEFECQLQNTSAFVCQQVT